MNLIKQNSWWRISEREIRNLAAAESEGGQKFLPPNPFPFARPSVQVSSLPRFTRQRVNFFQKGSRKVYNYNTKTNLFGIDCSAGQNPILFCEASRAPRVRRAKQSIPTRLVWYPSPLFIRTLLLNKEYLAELKERLRAIKELERAWRSSLSQSEETPADRLCLRRSLSSSSA